MPVTLFLHLWSDRDDSPQVWARLQSFPTRRELQKAFQEVHDKKLTGTVRWWTVKSKEEETRLSAALTQFLRTFPDTKVIDPAGLYIMPRTLLESPAEEVITKFLRMFLPAEQRFVDLRERLKRPMTEGNFQSIVSVVDRSGVDHPTAEVTVEELMKQREQVLQDESWNPEVLEVTIEEPVTEDAEECPAYPYVLSNDIMAAVWTLCRQRLKSAIAAGPPPKRRAGEQPLFHLDTNGTIRVPSCVLRITVCDLMDLELIQEEELALLKEGLSSHEQLVQGAEVEEDPQMPPTQDLAAWLAVLKKQSSELPPLDVAVSNTNGKWSLILWRNRLTDSRHLAVTQQTLPALREVDILATHSFPTEDEAHTEASYLAGILKKPYFTSFFPCPTQARPAPGLPTPGSPEPLFPKPLMR